MNFLTLVQSLHVEAKLPGSAPTATASQTGRRADLVRWIAEAWKDIQRDKDGRWKWLRSDWTLDTVADTPNYEPADCDDVAAAVAIDRFRAWEIDDEAPPFIYLVSEGEATERELCFYPWIDFRRLYVRGTHESAPPSQWSVDPADNLWLGPTPDGIYRLNGSYWKSAQTLAVDADEPEMPEDFHMLIVYRALVKYAYNTVGADTLARARAEGQQIYDALKLNQGYARFRMRIAGALA